VPGRLVADPDIQTPSASAGLVRDVVRRRTPRPLSVKSVGVQGESRLICAFCGAFTLPGQVCPLCRPVATAPRRPAPERSIDERYDLSAIASEIHPQGAQP
jgi:hypothetical protein